MLRLLGLVVVTLIGFYVVLAVYGTGDPRAARRQAEAPAPRTAAQDAGTSQPKSPSPPAAPAAEPVLVRAEAQTPEQVQRFPGPPLRPSPEYPNGTPAASGPAKPTPGAQATDDTPPDDTTAGPRLYVTGDRVNFRAGPSTGQPVIGALTRGTAVQALGPTEGDWIKIRDAQGREGFMSGRFLSADPTD